MGDKIIYPEGSNTYLSIKEWREDERPRERMAMHGAHSLSDAELLAILIGNGTRNFSAIDAGRSMLDTYHNITELSNKSIAELKQINGIGDAKAITIKAAFELAKRVKSDPFKNKIIFKSPEAVAEYFIPILRGDKTEKFRILLLNSANQLYRDVVISEGSLNASIVHPREVFKVAVTESAASIVLLHNHPSGNPEPSKADIDITKKLTQAGNIFEIKVLDHLIIAGDDYMSFANRGLL